MPKFSIRPTLTFKGRTWKGIRGWSGKPFHPPLTDFPIVAYILGAAFDVISYFGRHHSWGHDFYRAGTFTMVGGAVVSVFAALTGFFDWWRSSEKNTQVRRTINTHAWTMITVTVLAVIDIVLRLGPYRDTLHTPGRVMMISVVTALLVAFGALFGGALVYEYGFNVETAGDHPAYHPSDDDVPPGKP